MAYENKSWKSLFGKWNPYKASLKALKQQLSFYSDALNKFDDYVVNTSEEQLIRERDEAERQWQSIDDKIIKCEHEISDLKKQIGFIGSIFNTEKTQRIRAQITKNENFIKKMKPEAERRHDIYWNKWEKVRDKYFYCQHLQRLEIINECIDKIERANDKQLHIKNELAKNAKEKRQIADGVKNLITKNRTCPYCGRPIDYKNSLAAADHIYPIAKGGQSTVRNMVYICRDCNLKKGTSTLNQFIKKYNLDRDSIERNLTRMHKDF